jgi:hypothetical protein
VVQVDVFWSYAIGAGFGVAAARCATASAARRDPDLADRHLSTTVLYLACLFGPSGIWLLWRFTSWETMHAATAPADLPPWLVAGFAITNVTQGLAGYLAAQALWRAGHRYLAWLQMPLGYLAMFFVLAYGWDGTGYRRFFAPTPEAWRAGSLDLAAFLTSDVAITLCGMGAVLLPPLLWIQASWWTRGYRSAGVDGPGPARLIALGLLTALGLGLGAAVAATALLIALGPVLGLPAVALLLAGALHPRGPAGRLAAAFRIDPATERQPAPVAAATAA